MKTHMAESNGFRCIHAFDWDSPELIVSLLQENVSIMARKCKVKEVPLDEAVRFLDDHHLQGYSRCSCRLGLYHDGELVSIMTFGKPRFNKNYEWELIRYCSKLNVTGGAERLFSHFVKMKSPKSIVSYCDLSKFTGELYPRLGFSLKRISQPTCHWFNIKTGRHILDSYLRSNGYDRIFGTSYGKGTSNEQLMLDAGFVRVYDCGQATYTWQSNH